jgi:hypothetical protein
MNFDGTNKGNGDGKGKFGAWGGKSGEAPGKIKNLDKGGTKKCDAGITDTIGNQTVANGTTYILSGFTGIGNSCKDSSSQIRIEVFDEVGDKTHNGFKSQGEDIIIDAISNGIWEIKSILQNDSLSRYLNVTGVNNPPTATAIANNTSPNVGETVLLTGSGNDSDGTIVSYLWEKIAGNGNINFVNASAPTTTFDAPNPGNRNYTIQLTVTDNDGGIGTDTILIQVP